MKKPSLPTLLMRKALNSAIARLERAYQSMESRQPYDLSCRVD